MGRHGDTKRQSEAVPILLLALLVSTSSAFSNFGVFQGLSPQPQLPIASVYHSVTSAVLADVRHCHEERLHDNQPEWTRGTRGAQQEAMVQQELEALTDGRSGVMRGDTATSQKNGMRGAQ